MFWISDKFAVVFLLLLSLVLFQGESYCPPGTVKHPLGDEALNNDILENPSISEKSQKDFQSFQSSCTRKPEGSLENPYVPCSVTDVQDTPKNILFSTNILQPSPELNCKRCDLQVQEDNERVLVRCYECYEESASPANRHKRDIVYMTYFLEIPSYSNVGALSTLLQLP